MARGRKGGVNSVLTVVVIVVTIVALIAPIALVVGYVYYRYKLKSIKNGLVNSVSDFWLDDEEKKVFKETNKKLALAEKNIAKAKDKGTKSGILLNVDGTFSARSNLGKEIRSVLAQYQPERDQLSDFLDEIANEPINRWNKFNICAQRSFACFWAFICWIVTFAVTLIVNYTKLTPKNDAEAVTQGIYVAAGIAIVSFFIFYFAGRKKGNTYSPSPPVVSLGNVNFY